MAKLPPKLKKKRFLDISSTGTTGRKFQLLSVKAGENQEFPYAQSKLSTQVSTIIVYLSDPVEEFPERMI